MAATSIAFEALLRMGGRAVSASVIYGASKSMLQEEKQRRGIDSAFVDILDLKAVEDALSGGADMLFCESISNPLMEVADIPRLAELAHRCGAVFVVDNTFATPMLLRPIEHGADVVIHSLTKYMNGHDDIMGGSVSVSGRFRDAGRVLEAVRHAKTMYGPVLSPFEAWLVLRGMRTLGIRMERHSENAAALADALSTSKKVAKVCYPGLEAKSDASSPAARMLQDGFGGMLSFELKGGRETASRFISSLSMAAFVPSLGSYATTISHPGSTSHRGLTGEERLSSGITDGLIRVSVGLEDIEDIVSDFISALGAV
jgi:cystathionine beta-lyase/cystathionine gamma-synthase